MVERIWLATEEPSAAIQILLRHSGPILSTFNRFTVELLCGCAVVINAFSPVPFLTKQFL